MEIWIATDKDGKQYRFTNPKGFFRDGFGFWDADSYDKIELLKNKVLPDQTWEDEPQLVEFMFKEE